MRSRLPWSRLISGRALKLPPLEDVAVVVAAAAAAAVIAVVVFGLGTTP